jgi:V8-like Glu-specific endopeptidase
VQRKEPLSRFQASRIWSREDIAEFAFPQPPRAKSRLLQRRDGGAHGMRHVSAPGLPAAGDITLVPELMLPRRRLQARGQSVEPLFVYPPDGRHVFKDTTFPWRACGRVTTNAGQGAGALVGPRHLLTASHLIGWTGSDAGWLQFQPDFYDTDVFPSSYADAVYSYEKTATPSGAYDAAEDYVVVVLKDRLGDQLGWLGTTTYADDWDGGSYWSHVGYPGAVGGGTRPAWELWFSIANSWPSGSGSDIETFASLNQGDSGGPVFGWWPEGGPYGGYAAGPYIVAVVSGQGAPAAADGRTGNWLAGGSELPDLVNEAVADCP